MVTATSSTTTPDHYFTDQSPSSHSFDVDKRLIALKRSIKRGYLKEAIQHCDSLLKHLDLTLAREWLSNNCNFEHLDTCPPILYLQVVKYKALLMIQAGQFSSLLGFAHQQQKNKFRESSSASFRLWSFLFPELVYCYYRLGQYNKVIRALKDKGHLLQNNSPALCLILAQSLYRLGLHDKAIKYFDLSKTHVEAHQRQQDHLLMEEIEVNMGAVHASKAFLTRQCDFSSNSSSQDALYNQATSLIAVGKRQEAAKLLSAQSGNDTKYQMAVALDSTEIVSAIDLNSIKDKSLYSLVALHQLTKDNVPKLISLIKEQLHKYPPYQRLPMAYNLGFLFYVQGKHRECRQLLFKTIMREAKKTKTVDSLLILRTLILLHKINKSKNAHVLLQRLCLDTVPRAMLLWIYGMTQEACQVLTEAGEKRLLTLVQIWRGDTNYDQTRLSNKEEQLLAELLLSDQVDSMRDILKRAKAMKLEHLCQIIEVVLEKSAHNKQLNPIKIKRKCMMLTPPSSLCSSNKK